MLMARKKYNYFSDEIKDNQKLDDFFEDKKEVKTSKVRVTTELLNVRRGPALNNSVVEVAPKGTEYEVFEEKDGWGRITDNKWIMLQYTVKI